MDKPISEFSFKIMAWMLRNRDNPEFTSPFLDEVPLAPGMKVVDFGCGPGSFSIAAAKRIGASGIVYSVDIHPSAIRSLHKKMELHECTNIRTILTGCATGLETGSIDVVLLYDIFHLLDDEWEVLQELHRVLKDNGILSLSDHHLEPYEIRRAMDSFPFFTHLRSGEKTISYQKS